MNDGYKKLTRSKMNRMICGVCGGIAEYLGIDPTLVRLLWALTTLVSCGVAISWRRWSYLRKDRAVR